MYLHYRLCPSGKRKALRTFFSPLDYCGLLLLTVLSKNASLCHLLHHNCASPHSFPLLHNSSSPHSYPLLTLSSLPLALESLSRLPADFSPLDNACALPTGPRGCSPGDSFLKGFTSRLGRFIWGGALTISNHNKNMLKTAKKKKAPLRRKDTKISLVPSVHNY